MSLEEKNRIHMSNGGKAWRGFFAVGEELTKGLADEKEGIYFGTEETENEESKGLPLHGRNLWPDGELGETMRETVTTYMSLMRQLGHVLMKAIACELKLDDNSFLDNFREPTELFRIFNYPPHNESYGTSSLGVGEHTDYGFLTILRQDSRVSGLQVKTLQQQQEWIDAGPIDNTFVINLGDSLEFFTNGLFKATPHRVTQRTNTTLNRLSFPYFFDPNFHATMRLNDSKTYGEYLVQKVSRVFPQLWASQQQ